ncbi:MAG: primosomal protein N', partial [Patescibacteria group bacterium]
KFRDHKADILIGTQMISKGWDLPDLALVGIIEADALFSLPDYFTDEKGFQLLLQLQGRLARPNSRFQGSFLIQTFHPENKLIQLASEKNYGIFFQNQINQRQTLQIPPFSKMLRLIFQDLKEEKAEKEALRFFQVLQRKKLASVLISAPQKAFLGKIRGRFRQQITLKLLKDADEESLKALLSTLPSGWIIDVDPISLI